MSASIKDGLAKLSWHTRLSKVQGSQEERVGRMGNTLSELRTQLTPQFAKSASGASGSAGRQAGAASAPGGFTVAELTVSMVVLGIMLFTLYGFTTYYFSSVTRSGHLVEMTTSSQNLLRATVDELRYGAGVRVSNTINDPNAPVGGWNTSNSNFVIIIAVPAVDANRNYIINPDAGTPYINELVYFKSGTTLYKRTLANPDAVGDSLTTSCPAAEASPSCPEDRQLAEHLDSMVFTLYDQDDVLTTDPLLARSVKINLNLKQQTFGNPLTMDNSIRVTLRNKF